MAKKKCKSKCNRLIESIKKQLTYCLEQRGLAEKEIERINCQKLKLEGGLIFLNKVLKEVGEE